MLNWVKQSVGITEPIYGPSAIQSVAEQTKTTPHTASTADDLKWIVMDSTCVETKCFYMTSDDGHIGLCQILYSNVMGIKTTAQFSTKIFSKEPGKPHKWSTQNLSNFSFSDSRQDFHAPDCSIDFDEAGKSYHIKSSVDKSTIVDLKFVQAVPGFVAGKDGTSSFGTDPAKPWGRMKHAFWPRCRVEGTIITPEGPIDFNGKGMFVHALQGMKPHFAAAKWNFANFQSPSYSAILMNYTTPASYGETVVTVGGLTSPDAIILASANPAVSVLHTEIKGDSENDWPEPSSIRYAWTGKTDDGKDVSAVIEGSLGTRSDKIDVMGEVPKFVKQIVAGAAGTKPYIYQFTPKMKITVDIGGQVTEEEGQLFAEATFIS